MIVISALLAAVALFYGVYRPFLSFYPLNFHCVDILFEFYLTFVVTVLGYGPYVGAEFAIGVRFCDLSFPVDDAVKRQGCQRPVLVVGLEVFIGQRSIFHVGAFRRDRDQYGSVPQAIAWVERKFELRAVHAYFANLYGRCFFKVIFVRGYGARHALY